MNNKDELSLFNNRVFDIWPYSLLSNILDDSFLNNIGLGGFGGFSVDVRENQDSYIIDAEMPGLSKENINIDISDSMLTISAHLDEDGEQKDEEGYYLRKERHTGSFSRSFSLDNIKSEEIKAEMKNGILSIYCPKESESSSNLRRIQIQ